jgi:hypothetical protein
MPLEPVEVEGRIDIGKPAVKPRWGWILLNDDGVGVYVDVGRLRRGGRKEHINTLEWALISDISVKANEDRRNAFGGPARGLLTRPPHTVLVVEHVAGAIHVECHTRVNSLQAAIAQWRARLSPGPHGGPGGLTTRLRDLTELHSKGALTDDEFAAAKRKLLA